MLAVANDITLYLSNPLLFASSFHTNLFHLSSSNSATAEANPLLYDLRNPQPHHLHQEDQPPPALDESKNNNLLIALLQDHKAQIQEFYEMYTNAENNTDERLISS